MQVRVVSRVELDEGCERLRSERHECGVRPTANPEGVKQAVGEHVIGGTQPGFGHALVATWQLDVEDSSVAHRDTTDN